jgi:hypothetical protein
MAPDKLPIINNQNKEGIPIITADKIEQKEKMEEAK